MKRIRLWTRLESFFQIKSERFVVSTPAGSNVQGKCYMFLSIERESALCKTPYMNTVTQSINECLQANKTP
jgi:hypothetical protein